MWERLRSRTRTTVPLIGLSGGAARRRADIAAHQDAVAVQGGGGGAFLDHNFLDGGIVGLEEAATLAGDAEDAGDEVGWLRQDVAVALGAEEAAGFFERRRAVCKACWSLGRRPSSRSSSGHIGRGIIVPPQEFQDIFVHEGQVAVNMAQKGGGGKGECGGNSGGAHDKILRLPW